MIVLVDGPSGSGKTTLATRLGILLRLPVIHMDDFYPGWSGLAAGSDIIAASVLKTTDPGYYRWDWANDRAGEWVRRSRRVRRSSRARARSPLKRCGPRR